MQEIPKVISEEHVFAYPKALRSQFEDEGSGLIEKWYRDYRFLFDEHDFRLATGPQRKLRKHFVEWYTAIKMYEKTGYYSLSEKYECPSHTVKQDILKELLPDQNPFRFIIEDHPIHGRMQCPDLVLYKPDLSDWYFCEVKGPKDALRLEQALYWQELINITGKRIVQVNLTETA
jgi:hypothetical protein